MKRRSLAAVLLVTVLLAVSVAVQARNGSEPATATTALQDQKNREQNGNGSAGIPPDRAQARDSAEAHQGEGDAKVEALAKQGGVTIATSTMAGVRVHVLTPEKIAPENAERVLLHLHGGGFVLGGGLVGAGEAVFMAGFGGIRCVSVDYRLAPEYPYPAALDDALAVYKELLRTYPAEKIGVFGTSAGGGLTLSLVLRLRQDGIPLPGAIAACTPWSDMTGSGDTYHTLDGVDSSLVRWDGWLKQSAEVYAHGHDLRDPLLSPVYGDFSNFPPTLLVSGTRDLFLSNTVRVHTRLRQLNLPADLLVYEGQSHAQYLVSFEAPETVFHFHEMKKFFDRWLQ